MDRGVEERKRSRVAREAAFITHNRQSRGIEMPGRSRKLEICQR